MIVSSVIDASLTTQSLVYRPGGPTVSFGVSVMNRSEQFASFQLEILAAGASEQNNWYHLSPDVSTAKSPGDRTDFQIEILDTPLPNFVGTVNLMVRVFSPQLGEERRLVLRLMVEPSDEANLLRVGLPVERLHVYPRNSVDIPVTVKNLGSQPVEVFLQCTELDSTWLIGSAERRLTLEAKRETTATFQCQPPGADQVASRDYPFVIIAKNREGATVETRGVVEVLPVGFMQFDAQPHLQRIPAKRPWLPNWRSRSGSFQLMFKNNSNLLQTVDLEVRGQDAQRCQIQVDPEKAVLPLAEITPVTLTLTPRRPWIGWARKLKFEVKPWLSDPRLGSTDPATQVLSLKVFPVIPLWLLLALLAMIAAILFRPTAITHMAGVNAVRLSGTSGRLPLVLSGSDDCSIRSWSGTEQETLDPQGTLGKDAKLTKTCTSAQPSSSKGLLAITQQAIRSLALIPVKNNQVFAGLENGMIQVWDINTDKGLYTLKDPKDQTSDRILDLTFTRNSLTLYSSYGSGTVRSWQRPRDVRFESKPAKVLKLSDRFAFQAWSLALSPDEKTLVSAGQFKRLILWDVSKSKPLAQQLRLSDDAQNRGDNDFFWDVNFAPNAPVLAASDSDGYITFWNLGKCQKAKLPKKPAVDQLLQTSCQQLARWQASQASVRRVLFTPDQHWLVSAGDDGKILAWHLTDQLTPDPTQKPKMIATLPSRVTSLDLIAKDQGIWIASGSEDAQVRLHRFNPDE
jgi:WD40 repeat protein